jgi:hypothetical protein
VSDRLLRCPWCPRHFVAPRPAVDTASAKFAATREAYELLAKHVASKHGRERVELQRALARALAGDTTRKIT